MHECEGLSMSLITKTIEISKLMPVRLCFQGVATVLVTLFYYTFYHVYDDRLSQTPALIMLCVGLILILISIPSSESVADIKITIIDIATVVVLLILVFFMPFTANVCLVLIALSKLTCMSKKFAHYSVKFEAAAKILCLSLLLFILYYLFLIPKTHELPGIFAFAIQHISGAFGFNTMSDGHLLLVNNTSGISRIAVSMDNLNVLPLLFTSLSFIYCISLIYRITRKFISWSLFTIIIFIVLRFLVLSGIYAYFDRNSAFFWSISSMAVSQILYVLILFIPVKLILIPANNNQERNNKKPFIFNRYSLIILLGIVMFILGFKGEFHPSERQRNIFIDEYHSFGWASATEPLDRENFGGQRSTYTFTSFAKFLGNFGDVSLIQELYEYEALTPNDILIIKTPIVEFNPQLIETIHAFVRDGGSLFLIGDHTNLLL